jgi:group I intron endonuclease
MKQSGIYGIRNLKTGEWYIGASKNLDGRKQDQLKTLKDGHNQNKFLQAAYDEYGADRFAFVVLEYVPVDKLNEHERYQIAHHKANCEGKGYNIARGGSQSNPERRAIILERRRINNAFEARRIQIETNVLNRKF